MPLSRTQVQRSVESGLSALPLNGEVTEAIRRQREEGLGWRFDGLGAWSTEAIFDKLRELGVDTGTDRFAAQARAAGRCSALCQMWTGGRERHDLWDDFPFVASEELWQRLTPDLLCPETVSRRIDAALAEGQAQELEARQRDIQAAVLLMDYLDAFPADERAARYNEVADCSLYDYSGWLLDMILSHGGDYPDEITRIADVMAQVDAGNAVNYQGDLPHALARAGRREEAVERIEANLRRFPENAWIRVYAGDVYEELLHDPAMALRFYIEALGKTSDPADWDAFRGRALSVLQKTGRAGEWPEIEQEHPRPAEPPSVWQGPRGDFAAAPFRSGPKVGVNDPCPCESGKKYKKCCRR